MGGRAKQKHTTVISVKKTYRIILKHIKTVKILLVLFIVFLFENVLLGLTSIT